MKPSRYVKGFYPILTSFTQTTCDPAIDGAAERSSRILLDARVRRGPAHEYSGSGRAGRVRKYYVFSTSWRPSDDFIRLAIILADASVTYPRMGFLGARHHGNVIMPVAIG